MTVVVFISLILIFYTFFGYPFYLYLKTKNIDSNRLTWKYPDREITILMVVCNEGPSIGKKIENLFNLDYPSEKMKLIVVDDASDDETVEVIRSYNDPRLTLLIQPERSGKSAGLNIGMESAQTELVLLVDARQEITLNSLRDLSSWFYPDSKVAAVSGEVKFRDKSSTNSSGMDAYQKYERFIRKAEALTKSVPGVSGAIYMLRREQFKPIPKDTILDDVLIPMVAAKNGDWIGFDERAIAWDIPSDDMEREKRRKTRTLNGNYQLLFRNLNWCFPWGHPLWFEYLSHKVLRLAAPFLALLALVFSLYLSIQGNGIFSFIAILIALSILVYPVSIMLPVVNRSRIIRIASSFVALNWFNLLGFFQFVFSPRRNSWK